MGKDTTATSQLNNIVRGGGEGEKGKEICEKSAKRSNNFGNDCRYLLGFYDYMLNFIDIIRTDEDKEIELQPEDTFIP